MSTITPHSSPSHGATVSTPGSLFEPADDAEVAEISLLFTKWFLNEQKEELKEEPKALPSNKENNNNVSFFGGENTANISSKANQGVQQKDAGSQKSMELWNKNNNNSANEGRKNNLTNRSTQNQMKPSQARVLNIPVKQPMKDVLQFDDLLTLVNEMEKENLLDLKRKIDTAKQQSLIYLLFSLLRYI
ncbi:hypothetical protein RFI_12041 [Reticulomyxa filosa]|uniref:Uncharacterized protein n=1 Tax=Reticulomyxa filosa TaxID=46433 RepID=X6NIC3_RETFI|nr:hypothetical protein RFI_12041 [Reticulomyxa filosa]|eukprot:ETO25102.1 hypothetical protein RFI_12041 [Reticulomyxa filosa]